MDRPIEKVDISTKDVGISMGIGDPWVNIKTAVHAGASHVELGFMGAGKGSVNNPTGVTPEIIGKDKREDIRQFAKINRVNVSTHASANIAGFTGLTQRGFSEEELFEIFVLLERERIVDQVKSLSVKYSKEAKNSLSDFQSCKAKELLCLMVSICYCNKYFKCFSKISSRNQICQVGDKSVSNVSRYSFVSKGY